jgi:hypothetical protein
MGTHQTWDAVVKGSKKYRLCFGCPKFGFLKTLIERPFFDFAKNEQSYRCRYLGTEFSRSSLL